MGRKIPDFRDSILNIVRLSTPDWLTSRQELLVDQIINVVEFHYEMRDSEENSASAGDDEGVGCSASAPEPTTVNNHNINIENGIVVQETVGDVHRVVAYIGQGGIDVYLREIERDRQQVNADLLNISDAIDKLAGGTITVKK